MAWSNNAQITIDHTKCGASDSTNFPLFFGGQYPQLAGTAFGGGVTNFAGFDIIFATDSAGASPIAFERVTYNPATGLCGFHVLIATLSHTSDTVIFVLWGNTAITTDQATPTSVWNANYKGVWHLVKEGVLSVADSTSNGNSGVAGNNTQTLPTVTNRPAGIGGVTCAGSGVYIPSQAITTFTIEAWVYPNTNAHTGALFGGANANSGVEFRQQGTNKLELLKHSIASQGTSSGAMTLNAWNHVAVSFTTGTGAIAFFINGVASGTATSAQTYTTMNYYLGLCGNGENWFGGLIELRFSNSVRIVDWFLSSYNNQNSPSTFYSTALTAGTAITNPGILLTTFPVMGLVPTPITDADRTARHQIIKAASRDANAPGFASPVPVGAVLQQGTTGTAYSETITAQGGTAPYTYAVIAGSLPTGLSLAGSTGVISGTPTVVATSTFSITVTDVNGYTGSQTFSITVAAPASGGVSNYGFVS